MTIVKDICESYDEVIESLDRLQSTILSTIKKDDEFTAQNLLLEFSESPALTR